MSSVKSVFTLHEVKTDDILNFKEWWPKIYKTLCISVGSEKLTCQEKVSFPVSKSHSQNHKSWMCHSNRIFKWNAMEHL